MTDINKRQEERKKKGDPWLEEIPSVQHIVIQFKVGKGHREATSEKDRGRWQVGRYVPSFNDSIAIHSKPRERTCIPSVQFDVTPLKSYCCTERRYCFPLGTCDPARLTGWQVWEVLRQKKSGQPCNMKFDYICLAAETPSSRFIRGEDGLNSSAER